MSGRVQKECADDSDRIDDAVDPRVQVRTRLPTRIPDTDPPDTTPRDIDISPSRGKKRRPRLITRERRTRIAFGSTNRDTDRNSSSVLFSANVSYFFPFSALYIHTQPSYKTSPILTSPSATRLRQMSIMYHDSRQRVLNYPRCPVTLFRRKKLEHNT